MRLGLSSSAWWGPPRKFDKTEQDRRVSWLELFYDLVYVIAISRITHHFAHDISLMGLLEYSYLFMLIFWGWLNGSLYYDLHGNEGLRTRLMMLWQMMIIAALAVTLDLPPETSYVNSTVMFIIMQVFITYMWWSVGLYDRNHRQLNKPYTVLFLMTLALMIFSFIVPEKWRWILAPLILFCNFTPPFIANILLRRSNQTLDMSSSMFERLGLFTIIVFGELVLGVVNGIGEKHYGNLYTWLNFALAIAIVFSLWWIFFTLVSNRETKKGFIKASLLELLFIPTLITLGLIGACFSSLFNPHEADASLQQTMTYSIASFLVCVSLTMELVIFPEVITTIQRPIQRSLAITAATFLLLVMIPLHVDSLTYLAEVLAILLIEITYVNVRYYRLNTHTTEKE